MSIMVDMKISFISHLCDVEKWPMTNGRNVLPFALKSYTSWRMVDLDLPFSIWWFSNLAYGRCIFHVPVYHLPVEVHAYHLPMMKNMISTMCHLPFVYAPRLIWNLTDHKTSWQLIEHHLVPEDVAVGDVSVDVVVAAVVVWMLPAQMELLHRHLS